MSEDIQYTELHRFLRGEEEVLDLTKEEEEKDERFQNIQRSIPCTK